MPFVCIEIADHFERNCTKYKTESQVSAVLVAQYTAHRLLIRIRERYYNVNKVKSDTCVILHSKITKQIAFTGIALLEYIHIFNNV